MGKPGHSHKRWELPEKWPVNPSVAEPGKRVWGGNFQVGNRVRDLDLFLFIPFPICCAFLTLNYKSGLLCFSIRKILKLQISVRERKFGSLNRLLVFRTGSVCPLDPSSKGRKGHLYSTV